MHTTLLRFCNLWAPLSAALAGLLALAPQPSQAQTYPAAEALTIGLQDTSYAVPGGGVYYVAANAADNGTGTLASPWKIEVALDKAPAGSTLVCRGGTYRVGLLRIEKKLTIQPYLAEKVWFKGSKTVAKDSWKAAGNLWVTDWAYKFERISNTQGFGPKHIHSNRPAADLLDQVFVNGQPLQQRLTKAALTAAGQFYVDTLAQKLYLYDDPRKATVEATAYGQGILFARKSKTADATGAVVQGIGLAHYAKMAFNVQAKDVTVRNCTLAWNGFLGAGIFAVSGGTYAGNRIWYNGGNGIWGNQCANTTIARNHISYNNFERFDQGWAAAGVKIGYTDGVVFWGNTVVDNNAMGLWLDESCTNARFVRNYCQGNLAGIIFELCHQALVAGNTVVGPGEGILVEDATAAQLYNNTIMGCSKSIFVADGDRGDTRVPGARVPEDKYQVLGVTWETRDVVIKNNLVSNPQGKAAVEMGAFIVEKGVDFCTRYAAKPDSMVAAMNHNVYFRASASQPATLVKWLNPNQSSKCRREFATLAAFSASIGFDKQGTEVPAASANPLFVNASGGNYALLATSPARGAGQALPDDVAEALGWPAGVPVDAGAYRYVAQPQTISFAALPAATYPASAPVQLAATASSGLPVQYTVAGPATRNGAALTLTGTGTVTVTATQPGNADYQAAPAVTRSFAVTAATPTTPKTSGVINFEPAPLGAQSPNGYFATLGFVLQDVAQFPGALMVYGAGEGYASKVLHPANWNHAIRLRQTNGGAFDLASFQYAASRYGDAADATVTGTFANGTTQTKTFATSTKTLATLTLNWTDLTGVLIDFRTGSNLAYGAVDNFAVSVATAPAAARAAESAASALAAPEASGLSVYPNHGQATLELRAQTEQRAHVYVRNDQGHLVGLFTVPARAGTTQFKLPSHLSAGTYFIRTVVDGQARSFTLRVE